MRIKNDLPELPKDAKLICDIPGLEACEGYAIDKDANVWTCKAHNWKPYFFNAEWRKMKIKINNLHGYHFVIMCGMDKKDYTRNIHKLLSLSFIPNPEKYAYINHIDGQKSNNSLDNLEWCTQKHNAIHCIKLGLRDTASGSRVANSKLKESDVPEIFKLKKEGLTNGAIAAQYGVDTSIICRIVNRKRWKHVTI